MGRKPVGVGHRIQAGAFMTTAQLEALCAAANKRIANYIASVAGQQLRRMRESWRRTA